MIEFVCTSLHVRIALKVAMVTMQFQGPNVLLFRNFVFFIYGVQRNSLAPMKNCHGGERYVKLVSVV